MGLMKRMQMRQIVSSTLWYDKLMREIKRVRKKRSESDYDSEHQAIGCAKGITLMGAADKYGMHEDGVNSKDVTKSKFASDKVEDEGPEELIKGVVSRTRTKKQKYR